ncbi:MAG: Hsp20/alpha crystallin family protein [Promethearchaeota archaeon]
MPKSEKYVMGSSIGKEVVIMIFKEKDNNNKKDKKDRTKKFDDIFGAFRDLFNLGFDGFNDDIFNGSMNPFGFGFDLNDVMDFDLGDPINQDNFKTHGTSISYKWMTGMDKPEIRINGKPISPEDLNKFGDLFNADVPNIKDMLKNLGMNNFGFPMFGPDHNGQIGRPIEVDLKEIAENMENQEEININKQAPTRANLSSHGSPIKEPASEYEEPYGELTLNEKDIAEITIELPGVDQDRIIINYLDKKVVIYGDPEFGNRTFKKSFNLKFSPDKSKTKIEGRNGIYTIRFKK